MHSRTGKSSNEQRPNRFYPSLSSPDRNGCHCHRSDLYEGNRPIVAPVLLATFIAIIATPALQWLQRKRVPKWLAVTIILLVLLEIGSLLALVFAGELEAFRDGIPGYQERLSLLSEQLGGKLESMGVTNGRETVRGLFDPATYSGVVVFALSYVRGPVGTGLLVLLAVLFILLEAPDLSAKLRSAFNTSEVAETRIHRALGVIRKYMAIKSAASLATATCIGVVLQILGIDFAPLWAILAFLLNFIPFVGAIIMTILAVFWHSCKPTCRRHCWSR
jgi:AI-2 transport protein TqsA